MKNLFSTLNIRTRRLRVPAVQCPAMILLLSDLVATWMFHFFTSFHLTCKTFNYFIIPNKHYTRRIIFWIYTKLVSDNNALSFEAIWHPQIQIGSIRCLTIICTQKIVSNVCLTPALYIFKKWFLYVLVLK